MQSENLQQYVDSQVATISPFKVRSLELLEQANSQEVTDAATAKWAVALRKLITAHCTDVKNKRLGITRNFDAVKSQFIAAEKDVLEPAEEALKNIGDKILAYQEEQERIAREEAARVAEIEKKFSTNAASYRTLKACDERGAELKHIFSELPEGDQKNAQIKLAFTTAINALLTRKDQISTAEKDEAEQARLAAQRKREQMAAEAEAAKQARQAKPEVKTGVKTKMVFTVTNPALVPRSFCEPSDKLIREAIANGLREIPGVEIREERSF